MRTWGFNDRQEIAMHTFNRTWKIVLVGAALTAAFVVADVSLKSHAVERAASRQAFTAPLPDGIETAPISASESSGSTYGLDQARTTDW
jgi:hypothetical protein